MSRRCLLLLLALGLALVPFQSAHALIIGGEGNSPVNDPGWPAGAEKIFNHTSRIAWWEGPPFGGGQYHAECRGDAKAFNEVLAAFAKLESKNKRLIVSDGVGASFWLNMNREEAKREAARMDWSFMVWVPGNWERQQRLPVDINPNKGDPEKGPPTELHVYTGGNIRWADVKVPKGIEVTDNRLEAHGFKLEDGTVLEGTVTDASTNKPIAAHMRLDQYTSAKGGGYEYTTVAEAEADKEGHWLLKKAPSGQHRIVLAAEGYVERVVAYVLFEEGEARWHSYDSSLASGTAVAGQVTDENDKPIADVEVSLRDVATSGGRYESTGGFQTTTDKEGRFQFDNVPTGSANVWVRKEGYVRPGLGNVFKTPKKDVQVQMVKAAQVRVTVAFAAVERPAGYIVHIAPAGGERVGSWGGSANIDAKNQFTFKDVPPGRYELYGMPNPGSEKQKTDVVTVDLEGGKTTDVGLAAK